jgi:hypothetical protein
MTTKKRGTWPDDETSSTTLVDPLANPKRLHLDVPYLNHVRQNDSELDLERLRQQKSRSDKR